MSGSIPSAFGDPNILYKGLSGEGLLANQTTQNALMQSQQLFPLKLQGEQQNLAAQETDVVGRAATALLGLNEDQAAAAYPGMISSLRAQGYKLASAPDAYPGHAAVQGLVNRAMTVPQQIDTGAYVPPGMAGRPPLPGEPGYGAQTTPPGGGGGGTGGGGSPGFAGTPAPAGAYGQGGKGSSIQVPAEYMPFYQEASARTGIPVDVLIAQHRQESGFNPNATGRAGEIGIGQVMPSTAMAPGYGMAPLGTDPDKVRAALRDPRTNINFSADYLKARLPQGGNPNDPEAIRRALVNYNGGGDPNYVANVTRYLPASAAVAQAQPPGAPQAPPGAPATPRPYQVATVGPTPPPPSGGAPVAPAGTHDLVGPRPLPPVGAGSSVPPTPAQNANTPYLVPNVLGPQAQQPPAAAAQPPPAPAAPAQAQAQPPPAQQQPPAPAQGQGSPATGLNSPQYQEAVRLNNQAAQYEAYAKMPGPLGQRYAAEAQRLRAQAQLVMQADSVVQGPGGVQIHTLTGKQDDPAKPLADYRETSPGSGIWVGGPGTEPRFQPPGRLVVGPDGTVWQTGVGGAQVLQPSSPAAIAARKAAEAQGTKAGTEAAESLPKMMDSGVAAARAEGNIDYGLSQLDKAKAGGINTGYFSGALTDIQSALKSLFGANITDKVPFINVDPSAIGNIQTARKTLSVVSGSILQQILGPGSAITDAKIDAFIHAQPGIETDPDAVRRVLAWARSQFTYEREMGTAAVKDAAESQTGTLPLNWKAKYYRDHGFAPIYNPGTGEMQQPDGSAPGRTSPATPAVPVIKSDADFNALPSGAVFTDPTGQQRRKP